jgi:hypothetical protein
MVEDFMQDLRLVGVHDDGEHLLLSGTGGEMFRLPIDEALRVAASRTPAQVAAKTKTSAVSLSPRDIQARIRSGATAAQVAELSGMPLANVQRYEGPVLAEREYVAQQARKVEVAAPAPGHDIYRSAFGDNPATLDEMVSHRLAAHGIDSSTVEWDSWRRTDGSWTVVARFDPNPALPVTIGEEPPAMWTFSPARKSLQNANRWAQQLSELEPLDGPLPARRLSAVADRPFDFEVDGEQRSVPAAAPARDADGLLDMLRSRRGQRLGVDEGSDDALAAILTSGVPAAHPRPAGVPFVEAPALQQQEAEDQEAGLMDEAAQDREKPDHDSPSPDSNRPDSPSPDSNKPDSPRPDSNSPERREKEPAAAAPVADRPAGRRDGRPTILSRLSFAPRQDVHDDDPLRLHGGVSTDTREITLIPGPLRPVTPLPRSKPTPTAPAAPAAPQQDVPQARPSPGRADSADASNAGLSSGTGRHREGQRAGLDELLGGARPMAGVRIGEPNSAGSSARKDAPEPERQPGRPKRSSVPSWDEIVFGTRGD